MKAAVFEDSSLQFVVILIQNTSGTANHGCI